MFIEPIIIYLLLVTIFLLVMVLAVLAGTQISIFRKFSAIKKANEQLRTSLLKEEAQIIAKAREKGEKILASAQVNQKQLNELLDKEISRVSQKALASYQQSLNGQMEKNIKSLQASAGDFEKALLSSMEAEMAKQKEERLKRLSEKIFGVLEEASGEILNRSLSLSNHEDLIFEALEKAKKSSGL